MQFDKNSFFILSDTFSLPTLQKIVTKIKRTLSSCSHGPPINSGAKVLLSSYYPILLTLALTLCSGCVYGEAPAISSDLSSLGNKFLDQFLINHLKNKNVAFFQNTGNAGDALIWYGTLCLFKKLGISCTPYSVAIKNHPSIPIDVIVYSGGGNLVPYYHHCFQFLQDVMGRGIPVIVLPHTIQGHQSLLSQLRPNVTLLCREKMSYHYCKKIVPYKENVFLACDLAFFADLTPFTPSKKEEEAPPKNLFAFRLDCEINKLREGIPLPSTNQDISSYGSLTDTTSDDENFAVVERFIKTIDAYDVVWTDRLHVGIAAFLLGKKVHLFDNSYGKTRAVFASTIKPLDHHHRVIFHDDWKIVAQMTKP
jgi:exopolysaccharide biosynthesis predicted pyruvyltransferase EpsI